MKNLILSGLALFGLILLPFILSGQTTPAAVAAAMKNTDSTSCGILDYGGQAYRTVIIGTQCWMKDNLNIGCLLYTSDAADE